MGHGKWETGNGTREMGNGKWGSYPGSQLNVIREGGIDPRDLKLESSILFQISQHFIYPVSPIISPNSKFVTLTYFLPLTSIFHALFTTICLLKNIRYSKIIIILKHKD